MSLLGAPSHQNSDQLGRSLWQGSSVRWILLSIGAALVVSFLVLGLSPRDLVPGEGGLQLTQRFFKAAIQPATDYQADTVPEDAPSFLGQVGSAVVATIRLAAAGMGIALLVGFPLGIFACRHRCSPGSENCLLRRVTRLTIALMRSVHELIWAVIFLAAFGLTELVAAVALAIPYAGTLAKIFAEMLDESPSSPASALESVGASRTQTLLLARLPGVIGEVVAYAFYRFECAVRSSAVLGFLGIPTLGYFLKLSFDELQFNEVWTYLYALLALVIILDLWSRSLRSRLV